MHPRPSSCLQKFSFTKYSLVLWLPITETSSNTMSYNSQLQMYLFNKVQ